MLQMSVSFLMDNTTWLTGSLRREVERCSVLGGVLPKLLKRHKICARRLTRTISAKDHTDHRDLRGWLHLLTARCGILRQKGVFSGQSGSCIGGAGRGAAIRTRECRRHAVSIAENLNVGRGGA